MVLFSRAIAAFVLGSASSVVASSESLRSQAKINTKSRKLEDGVLFEDSCTALVGIGVDTLMDPNEHNQTWMSCVTPSGIIHDFPEICKEWVEDVSTKGKFKSNYTIVNVKGAMLHPSDRLYLPHFPPEFIERPPPGPSEIMFRSIGDRWLAAVRVITTDGIPKTTEDELRESLFFAEDSVTNQMLGCSQEKLSLHPNDIMALTGGPSLEETLPMTPEDCFKYGAGEETVVETVQGAAYTECPANSYICIGSFGQYVYNRDFAMPKEMPDIGGTKTFTCEAQDINAKNVSVKMHTYVYKTWFDLEMLDNEYMISQVEVGVGLNSELETIFSYPYTENATTYVGGTVKTGVLKTAKDGTGAHREITLLKLCVSPRVQVCKNISPTTPRNAYEFGGKLAALDAVAPYGFDNGVITVKIPHSSSESENVLRNAVTKKLLSIFGVGHPEELADFIMYCFPEGAMTREMYAFVDSWLSVYSDKYCTKVAAHMRGLGHNFGLGPSRVYQTWENDLVGLTGDTSFSQSKRCYNGAKLAQTGWYDPEEHTFRHYSLPTTFDLFGYTQPEEPGRMKIITFNRKNPVDMYLLFNWASGSNIEAEPEFANKLILDQMGRYGVQFDISYRVAVLGEGDTYFRKGFFEGFCDLNITVNAIRVDEGIASITFTGCIFDQPTESPTPAPTAPTVSPTPAPTFIPPPPCYVPNDLCETESDCCDGGTGLCLKISTSMNFNSRLVCLPAGTTIDPTFDPSVPIAVGPVGPPGECNDDGKCGNGENCFSCPSDCNGMLLGPKTNRYCCDASGNAPFSISIRDDRCNC